LNLKLLFLTVAFSGFSRKAPGTVGTAVSLVLGVLLLSILQNQSLFLLTVLVSIVAVKVIDSYEVESGEHDQSFIVIDELAGIWLTLSLSVSIGEKIELSTLFQNYPLLIELTLAFLLFRLFDIWKPSIIGRIDREVKGGLGVMGDDLIAGLVAGVLTAFLGGLIL
jgi:phosphatidylglycerophosphatase A